MKVIVKLTKANIKLPKQIDSCQLNHLANFFIDKTLSLVTITFTHFQRLQILVKSFDSQAAEKEINDLVTTSFKQKSEFLCFLYAFEKSFTPLTVSNVFHIAIFNRVTTLALTSLESQPDKELFERSLKLICFFTILN